MLIFETKRLILRQISPADAQSLFDIYQDNDVIKYMDDLPESIEEEQANITKTQECYDTCGFGLWATTLKESSTLIGRCGLVERSLEGKNEVEVSYLINRNYWGNGYATEATQGIVKYAIRTLGLKRLIALIHHRNKASLQIASKLTMNFESTLRLDGKLVSLYAFDLDYSGVPDYFNFI